MKHKLLVIISIAILFTSCSKNKKYTINGTLNYTNNIDTVYLYEKSISTLAKKLNAAPVINNKFTITGKIDTIQEVFLGNFDKNLGLSLILENTNYNIKINPEGTTVTGSKTHDMVFGFENKEEYKKIYQEYRELQQKAFEGVSMEDEKALEKARQTSFKGVMKINNYRDSAFYKTINNKKAPAIAKLIALTNYQDWEKYPSEKRKKLIKEYEKELGKNQINLKLYRKIIALSEEAMKMQETVKNGSKFKEIITKDINGKNITLSKLIKNNKYTLLEFWASWCSPCRAEIPNLKKAYKKYKKLGLEIYSVSIDEKKENWETALKEEKTTWQNGIFEEKEREKMMLSYGVQGVPASFLINENGIIIASNQELREFELDRTLSKLLKK